MTGDKLYQFVESLQADVAKLAFEKGYLIQSYITHLENEITFMLLTAKVSLDDVRTEILHRVEQLKETIAVLKDLQTTSKTEITRKI